MLPCFRRTSIDQMVEGFGEIADHANAVIRGLSAGGQADVDMQQVAMAAALDSIGELHFRTDLKQLDLVCDPTARVFDIAKINTAITVAGQKAALPMMMIPAVTPLLPDYIEFKGNVDTLYEYVDGVLEGRRRMLATRPYDTKHDVDFLGALCSAQASGAYPWLSDDDIRDQCGELKSST